MVPVPQYWRWRPPMSASSAVCVAPTAPTPTCSPTWRWSALPQPCLYRQSAAFPQDERQGDFQTGRPCDGNCQHRYPHSTAIMPTTAAGYPTQANLRIIDSLKKRLAIPEEKFHNNLDRAQFCRVVPFALDEAMRQGRFKAATSSCWSPRAGLTWGSTLSNGISVMQFFHVSSFLCTAARPTASALSLNPLNWWGSASATSAAELQAVPLSSEADERAPMPCSRKDCASLPPAVRAAQRTATTQSPHCAQGEGNTAWRCMMAGR